MTLKTLQKFREAAYKLLGTGKDAVMDLMDAVLVTRSVYYDCRTLSVASV